jgi:hypothetical protein
MRKPLASFVQIFESLLDRVLTDPKEDPKEWNKKIRYALGHQFSVFHSLLSSDIRKLVTLGGHSNGSRPLRIAEYGLQWFGGILCGGSGLAGRDGSGIGASIGG